MATLGITDLKAGLGVNIKGKDCIVLEAQHVKPGKGNTYVRTKYKDIRTGRVLEENFQQSAKFESVRMETREMQYLYNDGDSYWFMDNTSYEQLPVEAALVGENAQWLKENDEASILYAGDELISIEPQMFVELEVTATEPGFKGDTATNTTKPATLETGATIQVPTFVEIGDVLQIDTRDGRFIKRV